MLKSIFVSIAIFFASVFGVHHANVATPIFSQPAAVAAATEAPTVPAAPAPTNADNSASTSHLTNETSDSRSSPQATISKQYITQPVIERVIENRGSVLGASTDAMDAK